MDTHIDWAEFSPDLLSLILEKLPAADAVRYGAVCPQWYTIFKHHKAYCSTAITPWLTTIPTQGHAQNTAIFYSMAEGRSYTIHTPRPRINSRSFIGSSRGWLITMTSRSNELHLLQPLTGIQIPLPPITTLSFVRAIDDQDRQSSLMRVMFFKNAALSASPTTNNYTVMMNHDYNKKLSFARAGDKAWSLMTSPHPDCINEIIVHKGKFHTLGQNGSVVVWDWDPDNETFKPRVLAPRFYEYGTPEFDKFIGENQEFFSCSEKEYKQYQCYHLVESANGEQLMVIVRTGSCCPPFKVLLWDEKMFGWKHLKSLGGQVLFINCCGQHICLQPNFLPELQPNSIYYITAVNPVGDELYRSDLPLTRGEVYCMDSNTIKPLPFLDDRQL